MSSGLIALLDDMAALAKAAAASIDDVAAHLRGCLAAERAALEEDCAYLTLCLEEEAEAAAQVRPE